jgi:hypothetical protein
VAKSKAHQSEEAKQSPATGKRSRIIGVDNTTPSANRQPGGGGNHRPSVGLRGS